MKKERIKTKRGFRGIGKFMLGWFVGFLSTFLIIAGIGYWAYSSISVRKIEKWTKTEITDNKGIEGLTLKKAVNIANAIIDSGSKAYTLAKMEADFNVNLIGSNFYGISTDIIKNSPITELKKAIEDTVDTVTFNNILEFLDVKQDELGLLNTVLENEVAYYYNIATNKLYTNDSYTTEVGFDYTVNEEKTAITFGNASENIVEGKITPKLCNLPITTAMNSITDTTKDLKIYEILEFEKVGEVWYDNGNKVSGIMASLAEYSINDLSKQETVDGIYVYEVLGYTQTGTFGNYSYTDGEGNIITGAMEAIAGKTIGQLANEEEGINSLTLTEILDLDGTETGVLKALKDSKVKDISQDIQNLTLGQALDVSLEDATGVIKALHGSKVTELNADINNLQVYQVMGYTRTGIEGNYQYYTSADVQDDTTKVGGVMGVLAGKTINGLNDVTDEIKGLQVWEVMGYTKKADGWYDGDTKVTGIMRGLAESKVSEIGDDVKNLNVKDVFDTQNTQIFNLFADGELDNVSITQLPNTLSAKVRGASVEQLIDCGILTIKKETLNSTVLAMNIEQLITEVSKIPQS